MYGCSRKQIFFPLITFFDDFNLRKRYQFRRIDSKIPIHNTFGILIDRINNRIIYSCRREKKILGGFFSYVISALLLKICPPLKISVDYSIKENKLILNLFNSFYYFFIKFIFVFEKNSEQFISYFCCFEKDYCL